MVCFSDRIWRLEFLSKPGRAAEEDTELEADRPKLLSQEPDSKRDRLDPSATDDSKEETDLNDDGSALKVTRLGSILRSGEGRLVSLFADPLERLLACHGTDNTLELFLICSDREIQRRLARKAKKEKKRTGTEVDPAALVATVQEQFRRLKTVRAGGKIKSISVRPVKKSSFRVLMALGKWLTVTGNDCRN